MLAAELSGARTRKVILSAISTDASVPNSLPTCRGWHGITISHELRTSLTSILGWATVLEAGLADTTKISRRVAAIARDARAQAQLIDDLVGHDPHLGACTGGPAGAAIHPLPPML